MEDCESFSYAVKITGDKRIYDELKKGHVTLRFPKDCKKCRRHKKKLKTRTCNSKEDKEIRHHGPKVSKFTRVVEPHYTLTSPVEWQTSPLIPMTMHNQTLTHSDPCHNMRTKARLYDRAEIINNQNTAPIKQHESLSHSMSPYIVVNVPATTFSSTLDTCSNHQSTSEDPNHSVASDIARCRYCLGNYNSFDKREELISPCLCSGSSKYVHKSCLEKWLTVRNLNGCEVCRTKYETQWIHYKKGLLHFAPMEKRDVFLLFLTISLYLTLIFQFLGAVYVSIMADVLPTMIRIITLLGLSLGLFWFLIGSIAMTIVIYTSEYWKDWRNGRRRKILILSSNNNNNILNNNTKKTTEGEKESLVNNAQPVVEENIQETSVRLEEIDFSRPVPV